MATIVQRIAIEGGDAVVKQLEQVGAAGKKAITDVQNSVNNLNLGGVASKLGNFHVDTQKAFSAITTGATKLASVLGVTLGAGITGLAASLFALAKSGASAVATLNNLAKATGSTVDEISGLVGVFGKAGIGTDQLGDRFKRLAVATENAWQQIRDSIAKGSNAARRDQLSVAEAALSVEQSQVNLARAQDEAVAAAGSNDPNRQASSSLAARQAQLGVEKALLAQAEARQKQIETETNSIEHLTGAVDDLLRGSAAAAQTLSAEQLFKGVVAGAAQAEAALKGMSTNFADLASRSAPRTFAVLERLADVMKATKDETLKTALAAQVFGREVDASMIKQLSRGSEAFRQEAAELKRLGLNITQVDTDAIEGFKASIGKLSSYVGLVKDKIGVLFAPLAKQLVASVSDIFTQGIGGIQAFAQKVRDLVAPILLGLVNAIRGVSFDDFKKEIGNALPPELVERVRAWQKAFEILTFLVKRFFDGLGLAFTLLSTILGKVADLINVIFGTKLSADDLGVALIVARFTGLLAILDKVWTALGGLGTATRLLAPLLGWPALLIAAFALAVYFIAKNWDDIVAAAKAAWKAYSDTWDKAVAWFDENVTQPLLKLWHDFWTNVAALGLKAWNFLKSLFGVGPGTTAVPAAPSGGGGTETAAAGADQAKAIGGLVSFAEGGSVGSIPGFAKGGQADAPKENKAQTVNPSVDLTMTTYDVPKVTYRLQITPPKKEPRIGLPGSDYGSGPGFPGVYTLPDNSKGYRAAEGGHVRGPGSGTSDSILARLSNGEYVIRAAAVRRVGVGFLDRLNNAPGYALGGLVEGLRESLAGMVPRLAGGGLAPSSGGLRPFTLVLPGGASYGGLFAREDSVTGLRRASTSAQVSSTGRRPAWVK